MAVQDLEERAAKGGRDRDEKMRVRDEATARRRAARKGLNPTASSIGSLTTAPARQSVPANAPTRTDATGTGKTLGKDLPRPARMSAPSMVPPPSPASPSHRKKKKKRLFKPLILDQVVVKSGLLEVVEISAADTEESLLKVRPSTVLPVHKA